MVPVRVFGKAKYTKKGPDKPTEPTVDNKLRTDWNNFLMYLDKKGVRGKPDLDKGGAGYALFDQYVKENPTTSLNRQTLPVIRKELLNYRNWVLEQSKSKSPTAPRLATGVNETNFMRHVLENEKTGDPNYPGSNLTSTVFPASYLTQFNNGQNVGTSNQGFATTEPMKAPIK